MTKHPAVSAEQMAELSAFASVNGRKWKDDILYNYWMKGIPVRDKRGVEYPSLYGLRNTHGPSWLSALKLT